MSDSVRLRPLRRGDYPALVDLMRRLWYDDVADPDHALRLAEADFELCLSRSTTATVADLHGRAVGVILGRIDDPRAKRLSKRWRPLICNRHRRRAIGVLLPLLFSREGREGIHEMRDIARIDDWLIWKVGRRDPAEVTLFILDGAVHGQGVGRRLFDHMLAEFRAAGVERYFLFTDTTCNVGFYDHRHLRRRAAYVVRHGEDAGISFFLYEGHQPDSRQAAHIAKPKRTLRTLAAELRSSRIEKKTATQQDAAEQARREADTTR
ncbi:hypothetical protein [Bifidobacterium biavatii]|uniref:N-acetyltransferase GCN5 n=1 Tax=Bifidobacterium biavatii DSM 23969 TaxID=1437608 RepID=A0A086ZKG8_9BIFI|nr:hypothetical protein [Bifidobacterium biavatii]KFI47018.1 N-acetyltransferase GCN5 [Bifidobacterium biavatii DSM 23969]